LRSAILYRPACSKTTERASLETPSITTVIVGGACWRFSLAINSSPRIFRFVDEYVRRKVDFQNCNPV